MSRIKYYLCELKKNSSTKFDFKEVKKMYSLLSTNVYAAMP